MEISRSASVLVRSTTHGSQQGSEHNVLPALHTWDVSSNACTATGDHSRPWFCSTPERLTLTLVPNHEAKLGYRSDSSRDEEVCHVSTRNRHEQPMEVFNRSLHDSSRRCHICTPYNQRAQLALEDDDGSARGPTQSDKEIAIPPGVFQMGKPPGVYPEGLNVPFSKEKPWSGSGNSRWMPNGTSECNSTQPRGTVPLPQDNDHDAEYE